MSQPSKQAVLDALLSRVEADLAEVTRTQKATHAGATHEESRAENDKDTRALEATYLARGLARRVEDLTVAAARLPTLSGVPREAGAPIAPPALITLEDEQGEALLFLLSPVAGGTELVVEGYPVKVVSPAAPLGRALVGREVGDEVLVKTPGRQRELVIEVVS